MTQTRWLMVAMMRALPGTTTTVGEPPRRIAVRQRMSFTIGQSSRTTMSRNKIIFA